MNRYNSIKFDRKPDQLIIDVLKRYGFRWNRVEWYAEKSIESATVIDCIRSGDVANVGTRVAERMMESDCGII